MRRLAAETDYGQRPKSVRLATVTVFDFDRWSVRLAALRCSTCTGMMFDFDRNPHLKKNIGPIVDRGLELCR